MSENSLFNRILIKYIEITRFPKLPSNPKIGKNYEYFPPSAICGNGSPYHGCIRLGSENKLIIGFSGGGVSVNEYTAARPQRLGESGQMFYSDSVRFGDIVPRLGTFGKSNQNPFCNWSLLFVPYATGDFHCGTGDFKYKDLNNQDMILHHHGYSNYRSLLKKIKELVPNPDQILVTGFSAGAFATAILTDDIASCFPNCHDITACVDSAMLHYDWQKVAREVWKSPEDITSRFTGDEIVTDSLLALHRNRPDVKIMFCCSIRDAALTQMEMYLEDGRWKPDKSAGLNFQKKLKSMVETLQRAIPNLGIFIFDTPEKNSKEASLTIHCLCGSKAAFNTAVEGITCVNWMRQGVNGKLLKLGLSKLTC